jgi:hypothetical protein
MRSWIGILVVLCAMPGMVRGQAQDDAQAKALAQAVLDKGAAIFDQRDAKAMADTYLDAGQITLISRDSDSGKLKLEVVSGHAAIEKGYSDIFKDRQPDHKARNTVESARFMGPNTLLISGRFALHAPQGDVIQFVQIRTKVGDDWKIVTMQLLELP